MSIDARLVKELRELTGLPMMVCKKALEETGGDVESAREILRKQGQKVAESKAGRQTREGRIDGFVNAAGTCGVVLNMKCESEPVAKCADLVGFQQAVLDALKATDPLPSSTGEVLAMALPGGHTVKGTLETLVGKIRENIQVGGYAVLRGDAVFQYIHFDNRHGSMVALARAEAGNAATVEAGKNLCMHVVFAKPGYLTREEVPAQDVDKEREILTAAAANDPKLAAKPAEIRAKIVEGQLNSFFATRCLLEQPYVRDEKLTVQKYVAQEVKGAALSGFVYMGLGA